MSKFWKSLILGLTGSVLVSTAVVVSRYLKTIRSARKRVECLGSQIIQTACGPVEYVQVGEGYPVLSIHGAMGGFDQGLWLARVFNLSGYRLISPSRFGYLRSPLLPGADLNLQADAFAALLDALEIEQVIVFAASAGSTSAVRFAARHPDRISALILLGPDAPGKNQMPLPPRFIFDTLLRSDFAYWVLITLFGKWVRDTIGLVPMGYRLTPENEALVKQAQVGDLPVSRRIDGMIFETYACAEDLRISVTPASPYPLDQIRTPTLVINAADDPISIPENVCALAEQMPNARLFVVPDGGHFLFGHVEDARVEVAQFLRAQFLRAQFLGAQFSEAQLLSSNVSDLQNERAACNE